MVAFALCVATASRAAAQAPVETPATLPASVPATAAEAPELALSLRDAETLLLKNNLSLRAAWLDELIEETRIREALGAFDPTLYAEGNYGRRERLSPGLFPDPNDPQAFVTRIITAEEDSYDAILGVRGLLPSGATYDVSAFQFYQFDRLGGPFNPIFSTTAQLRLTQPLLRGAWSEYADYERKAAVNRTAQARQTYRGLAADRVRALRQAYFDLAFAYEDLEAKRRSVDVAEQLVAINRVKVDTGAFPPVEMTSAESGRAFRRSELVTAEARLLDAQDRLRRELFAFETASDWTVRIRPTEPLEIPEPAFLPLEELISVARASEPRLLRSRLVGAQAEADLARRRSETKPRLDAVGSAGFTGLDEDGLQPYAALFDRSEGSMTWSVGLRFDVPLGNRSASAREAAARLAVTRARIEERNLLIDVDYNVRKTLRDLEVAARVIRARAEALRLADRQVEDEKIKLEAQTSTNFQVFEIEDQRSRRRAEYVQALIDYRLAMLDLERHVGAPLEALTVRP